MYEGTHHAMVSTPSPDHAPVWGGPLSIWSSGFTLPRPLVPGILAKRPVGHEVRGAALAGILEEPTSSGCNPYLVFSFFMDGERVEQGHTAVLAAYESGRVRWFGKATLSLLWKDGDHVRSLRTYLNRAWMGNCFAHYGPPGVDGAGHAIACQMLPRRRPISFRLTDPLHLQAFIPLFHV